MIKNIKKIMCVLLALVISNTYIVDCFASLPSVMPSGRNYSITGECQPGKNVSLKVFPKDENSSDWTKLVAIGETTSNAQGVYEVSFVMPDQNGQYVAYVKVEGQAVQQLEPFTYIDTYTRNSFLTVFDGCSDTGSLASILSNDVSNYVNRACLEQYGVDLEYYDSLTDKSEFHNICLKEKNGITVDENNISEIINNTVMVMEINSSTESELANLVSQINLTYKEVEFSNLSNEKKSYIVSAIFKNKSYEKYSEFVAQYQKACILYDINNIRFSSLTDCINMYKSEFGIGQQAGVISYLRNPSDKVAEKFVEIVSRTSLEEIAQIGDVLSKAITEALGGQGDGGSSNNASFGSYSIGIGAIPNDTIKNENEQKVIFSDVPLSHWAFEYINKLYEMNVVSGKGNGMFDPNASIKREEFLKMLIEAANIDSVHFVNVFSDVEKNSWYYDYVNIAATHKIALGKSDGTFGVGEEISRQDACVFLYRAAQIARQYAITGATVSELSFEDSLEVSDYAKESIQKLFAAGVVNGTENNSFSPLRSITRAEVAKIIYSVFAEVK